MGMSNKELALMIFFLVFFLVHTVLVVEIVTAEYIEKAWGIMALNIPISITIVYLGVKATKGGKDGI